MKKLLLIVLLGLALAACSTATPTPYPTPSPYPTYTPYPSPTPIPTPTQTTVPSTPTPVPATATPTINPKDAAHLLGLMENVLPPLESMIETSGDIGEAAGRMDVGEMCDLAEVLAVEAAMLLVKMEVLPLPEHAYLVSANECFKTAVVKWGAAGYSISDFCDTLDVAHVENASVLLKEATDQLDAATGWVEKYKDEVQ